MHVPPPPSPNAAVAIECSCTACVTSPSCFGEHCFVITHSTLATTGEATVTTIRGCYNDSLNCGLNSATLGVTVDCCESDMCNDASFQPASPGGTNIPTPPREVPATPSPLSPNLKPYTSSNLPTDVPEDSTTGSVPTSPESETDTVEATDEGPFVPPVLIPSGGPMDPSPSSGQSCIELNSSSRIQRLWVQWCFLSLWEPCTTFLC